jgi:hypothetical protein
MCKKRVRHNAVVALAAVAVVWTFGLWPASAQEHGRWQPLQVLEEGTTVRVRTVRAIDERDLSGRVFAGVVDEDVRDRRGRFAIPRGAAVELMVRRVENRELVLDLESINIHGTWYGVDAKKRTIVGDTHVDSSVGRNRETVEHVGGGALIGSIVGAIVGGGKGAAIGAAAGAGVGAATQLQVHGAFVRIPAESLLTFRLESPLTLGWKDAGRDRDGGHYHDHGDDRR